MGQKLDRPVCILTSCELKIFMDVKKDYWKPVNNLGTYLRNDLIQNVFLFVLILFRLKFEWLRYCILMYCFENHKGRF